LIAIFDVHGEEDKGNDDADCGEHRDHNEEGDADARWRNDHRVAVDGRPDATWGRSVGLEKGTSMAPWQLVAHSPRQSICWLRAKMSSSLAV